VDQKAIDSKVKRFIKKLDADFRPVKIILFGSKARGDDWKRSDYDFIIVSPTFAGMHWLDRISRVIRLWESTSDIDVLPYTPEEFEDKKKNSSIVRMALKEGIEIHPAA
jgi:predicted nucleotidyltransferase